MSSPTLFITGATGFIGSHVVKNALAAGHRVRLSVRKEEQIDHLKKLFSSGSSQLDFAVIPDISKAEAFEGKLDGIEHVIHLASPMPGKGDDFKADYLKPSVEGTLSILKAAKASSSVKRVVVTSSLLACMPLGSMNSTDLKLEEDQDLDLKVDPDMEWPEDFAGGGLKYHASKILAHQATLDWMKENNPQFSLVTLHPSFVLGHSLIQKSAEDIGGINAMFWGTLKGDQPMFPPVFVDVRDVANAHLKAATVSTKDHTTEFLLSGNESSWDGVVPYIKSTYPAVEIAWTPPFPRGPEVKTSRADSVLGMKWHSTEEIFDSVISQQLGFLGK